MNKEKLSSLSGFHGTNEYHHMSTSPNPSFVYTDGVKYLATHADAYWLLVAIQSYQSKARQDPELREKQYWTLAPWNETGAILTCTGRGNEARIQQAISYTDFPFECFPGKQAKIWVGPSQLGNGDNVMVAFLPSEN